jgi:UDP-N-acetylglucosamine 1-carboxyvinyltransferase
VTTIDLDRIGGLIRSARKHRGLTQTQLAYVLGTSQSAVHRIEAGNQNLSLEMVNRIAAALDAPLISVGQAAPQQAGKTVQGVAQVRPGHRHPLQLQLKQRDPCAALPAGLR